MSSLQDRVWPLLSVLTELTREWSEARRHLLLYPPKPLTFAKEYRTVRFGSARQIGHTTAGLQLANERPDPTLFLTHNAGLARMAQELGKEVDLKEHVQILPMKSSKWRTGTYGLVIVDCATFLSHGDEDKVYALARDAENCPLFVFLQ